ncbi:MAG TPA: trimethylamine methyltransferase family protein [Fimbriimonas sp.]
MALRNPLSVLTTEQLDRMHASALRILETVGIHVERDDVREEIATRPGFRLVDGRIRIAPERIEAIRKPSLPPFEVQQDPASLHFSVDNRMAWIAEPDGRTLRAMTRDDVVRGTKLIHVLHAKGLIGSTPGPPQDVPIRRQPLEQYLIAAEFSPGGGSTQVTDLWTAEVVREMDRVYGREFATSVWCPSPLVLGGPELDILWRFRDELKWFLVGTMPNMGISGPCDLMGVYALSIAESLGGVAILLELLPGRQWGIHPHPEPADLRSGAMTMGSPEWELLDLMTRDVLRYYAQEWNWKFLLTGSSVPDAQAAAEKAVSATSGMLAGFDYFGNVGQLACDEIYSPAQLMIDIEIVEHAYRATRQPEPAVPLEDLADIVSEIVEEGMLFAEHESTISAIRKVYGPQGLFYRAPRGQWLAAGSPDLRAEAEAEANRLADSLEWEPPQEILGQLRKIADAAT